MSVSSRKESSSSDGSSKPGTSRLSLGKIRSTQSSTGDIAIRFSAASLDDEDEEDEIFGISCISTADKAAKETVGSKGAQQSDNKHGAQQLSVSAPVSEVTTPTGKKIVKGTLPQQTSLDSAISRKTDPPKQLGSPPSAEKSLLTELREKLQEKNFPDPLTAFIEKIEEGLSGDSSPEEGKEKKLRKGDSLEEKGKPMTPPLKKSESFDPSKIIKDSVRNGQDYEGERKHSSSSSRHDSIESDIEVQDTEGEKGKQHLRKGSSIDIVDDFFGSEPVEDFTGTLSASLVISKSQVKPMATSAAESKNGNMSSTPPKPMSALQKLMSLRDKGQDSTPEKKPVSISLSGLLSTKEEDSDGIPTPDDNDEFFDPHEDHSAPENEQPKQSLTLDKSQVKCDENEKTLHKEEPVEYNMIRHKYIAAIVCVIAYLVIPMPAFISGFIFGVGLVSGAIVFHRWLHRPLPHQEPFVLPELTSLPPLLVPEMKESKNEEGKYKGWMNELHTYNPDDYHISQTQSVYVQLEGTSLRLQRPKHNISRRAMWDEQISTPNFIHQRHYDLLGATITLLPPHLVKKRIWSKKYPICITLPKTDKYGGNCLDLSIGGSKAALSKPSSQSKQSRPPLSKSFSVGQPQTKESRPTVTKTASQSEASPQRPPLMKTASQHSDPSGTPTKSTPSKATTTNTITGDSTRPTLTKAKSQASEPRPFLTKVSSTPDVKHTMPKSVSMGYQPSELSQSSLEAEGADHPMLTKSVSQPEGTLGFTANGNSPPPSPGPDHTPPASALAEDTANAFGFEIITREQYESGILYLLARTGREKEEWYRRFVAASIGVPIPSQLSDLTHIIAELHEKQAKLNSISNVDASVVKKHKRQSSFESTSSANSSTSDLTASVTSKEGLTEGLALNSQEELLTSYMMYMANMMPTTGKTTSRSRATTPTVAKKKKVPTATLR